MIYKVWVEIEALTDDGDETPETRALSQDINASRCPFGATRTFDNPDAAVRFALALHEGGKP